MNDKFGFIKKKINLLDLGSCPGGWSQVVSKINTEGKILSVDLKDMEPIKNVSFLKCDIFQKDTKKKIIDFFNGKIDVIVSDMAADTTGNKSLDSIRTNQLCAEIIDFCTKILKPQGVLVSKVFMGADFIEVKSLAKSTFKNVNFYKPKSSKDESKETYLHCKFLKTL